jgi:4-hydroxy-3-polyprenylbenzoate decarboxylase
MAKARADGNKRIILGVTGASGALFARRALQILEADARVEKIHLVISGSGLKLLRDELDLDVSKSAKVPSALAGLPTRKTEYLLDSDVGASIASGSYSVDGMVIIPCTTGSLAQIAAGVSETLIERAADVCLKQRRPLILAVRDTPFNRIHLQNMLRVDEAGAVVFPIIPSYYDRPKSIDAMVTQFCCRVLAMLDLEQDGQFRWQGEAKRPRT